MSEFLDTLRVKLQAKIDERAAARAEVDAILAQPGTEGRADLTPEETAKFTEARAKVKALDAELDKDNEAGIAYRVADLEQMEARRYEAAAKAPATAAKVKSEARTYSQDAERRDGVSFLHDVAAGQRFGDPEANQRLARHMQEERVERPGIEKRAVATSAFAGLVVPQYLVDLVAPTRRAGRPLADIANKHPLPADGMTVNISRITTASSAAIQTQNSGASETNMDDTLLTIDVLTAAGQQTASIQALQRGTGIETVILGDLLGAVNTLVDSTMINQATTGLDAVTDANLDVAYTDASPTAAELWPKLFDAVQQVQTNYFGGVSHLVMHPRRFWWLASNVGTSFPFVNLLGAGPQSGGSVAGTGYGSGIAGYLAGLPVILDANIVTNGGAGTNEDRIYAVSADEVHLWEDSPVFIRAEQTNAASLGVLFVAYKYFAYSVSRYVNANARIAGTGLATPSF
jgi:HK97 family phage major capsid protein